MRFTFVLCALLACGCHESLGLVGDAHLDPSTEPPTDVLVDVIHDAYVDPVVDPSTDPVEESPCPPSADDDMHLDFYLDGDRFTGYDLTLICDLDEFSVELGGMFVMGLLCRSDEGTVEEHQLTFLTDPPVPIDIDLFTEGELIVRYVADPIFWINRWVTIQSDTHGLLLAAVDAETVLPGDREHWYDPLVVWSVGGRCPAEDDYCGTLERQAIEVAWEDASIVVFDGNIQPLDTGRGDLYHVMVPEAHAFRFVACEDVPLTWVQAFIMRLP